MAPSFPRLFLGRSEPLRLVGDRVFLRPPERGDYESWATLRARSRGFLAPWGTTWPAARLGPRRQRALHPRGGPRARPCHRGRAERGDQLVGFALELGAMAPRQRHRVRNVAAESD